MSARLFLLAAASLALANPALAHPHDGPPPPPDMVDGGYDGPPPPPEWHQGPMHPGGPGAYPPGWEQARADWLGECRRRHSGGKTATGAVLGGVVGGVIGNRVAGRGNRTVGTIAGAAVGAVAGGAIGSAADRRDGGDWCETYLERNMTWGQGYPAGGMVQGYGYAPMTMMVPVAYVQVPVQSQPRECKETVVYYDTVRTTTPARYRTVTTYKRVPDKRVRIVPDKRVQY